MQERKRRKLRDGLKKQLAEAEAAGDTDRAESLIEQLKQHGLLDK
jgi:hypothetical protein